MTKHQIRQNRRRPIEKATWSVIIHGGAGGLGGPPIADQTAVLESTVAWAEKALGAGLSALDAVEGAVRQLEDCGLFIAGRGARPNANGEWELDASIMDGRSRAAGAVAALSGVYPPISIARAVMERTDQVLLAGEGVRRFALAQGFEAVEDPRAFFAPPATLHASSRKERGHGTVGAVALDRNGAIAAATSTGGITNKPAGRIGDSPIVGAGTWADELVGVSCTGRGEFFIRTAAAHSVAAQLRFGKARLERALDAVLREVKAMGGEGGVIALTRDGDTRYGFNTRSMRVALSTSAGQREARVAVRR